MKRSLIALAIGTFALGIAEFAMMGILSDVADEMRVPVQKAGRLISAYSLGVAVGAPGLIVLRRMPLKRLMLLLAALIAGGNAFAAAAPGFGALLAARFVSGLPHGAFFGAGAIVCSRLADAGKGAQAVAVMVAGMTVANVVGVPLATFISTLVSWRLAFALVAQAGLAALAALWRWLPRMQPLPDTGIRGQFAFLRKPQPWLIYGGVFFGQAGVYTYLSYIDPIMTEVARYPEMAMSWIMVVAGAGMVTGNLVAGRLADRFSPSLVTALLAGLVVVIMPVIYFVAPYKVPVVILTFVATAALFGIGGPLQYLIVRYSRGGEMLGGAGIQIAFNVSNALAAALGGEAIHHGFGLASPALAGAPCALIGMISLLILHYHSDENRN